MAFARGEEALQRTVADDGYRACLHLGQRPASERVLLASAFGHQAGEELAEDDMVNLDQGRGVRQQHCPQVADRVCRGDSARIELLGEAGTIGRYVPMVRAARPFSSRCRANPSMTGRASADVVAVGMSGLLRGKAALLVLPWVVSRRAAW